MAAKKSTTKSTAKKSSKSSSKKKKSKPMGTPTEDTGIVIVDDDLIIDKEAELEARKAYLEEARSQESSD